jgi:hypothetical protein
MIVAICLIWVRSALHGGEESAATGVKRVMRVAQKQDSRHASFDDGVMVAAFRFNGRIIARKPSKHSVPWMAGSFDGLAERSL